MGVCPQVSLALSASLPAQEGATGQACCSERVLGLSCIPALLLSNSVTLNKVINFLEPQCPRLSASIPPHVVEGAK